MYEVPFLSCSITLRSVDPSEGLETLKLLSAVPPAGLDLMTSLLIAAPLCHGTVTSIVDRLSSLPVAEAVSTVPRARRLGSRLR